MTAPAKRSAIFPLDPALPGARLRLRTLVLIRWLAIVGQAAAILSVDLVLGYPVPLVPALGLVAASAAINLVAQIGRPSTAWVGEREAVLYLGYDLLQLSLLLGLTGGLSNPFSVLIVAPVIVSASILSRRSTVGLAAFAVLATSALAVWHMPLPWERTGFSLPPIYLAGLWVALVVAVVFIAFYVGSIASEARRLADALSATQVALAREQRLSALGGLAAAAAHQLGSPLGTIAVVAGELARELPPDSPWHEDAELLLSETTRCREILAELAERPEADSGEPYDRLPVSALVEAAAGPYTGSAVAVDFVVRPRHGADPGLAEPVVQRSPEILHGIGSLIQNAVQFALDRVEIRITWDEAEVVVAIRDDGPGFEDSILGQLGRPYLSTGGRDLRASPGEHMGLGIFIARTLLARSGAKIDFANRPEGGAEARVRWPRSGLETLSRMA